MLEFTRDNKQHYTNKLELQITLQNNTILHLPITEYQLKSIQINTNTNGVQIKDIKFMPTGQ